MNYCKELFWNFINFFRNLKIRVLCRVMGLEESDYDPDPTYELTIDNMKKMLAIHMRLRYWIILKRYLQLRASLFIWLDLFFSSCLVHFNSLSDTRILLIVGKWGIVIGTEHLQKEL